MLARLGRFLPSSRRITSSHHIALNQTIPILAPVAKVTGATKILRTAGKLAFVGRQDSGIVAVANVAGGLGCQETTGENRNPQPMKRSSS